MFSQYNTENLCSLLTDHIQQLRNVYKKYALLVHDEGLRKFLNSMASQEEANLDSIKEHEKELKACTCRNSEVEQTISHLKRHSKPYEELAQLERIDYLGLMLEIEKISTSLYKRCESVCTTTETTELIHSLAEDERRHVGLLQDRFELEQLI